MKIAKLRQDQADFCLFLDEANPYVDLCMFDYSDETITDPYTLCRMAVERSFEDMPIFSKTAVQVEKFFIHERIKGEEPVGNLVGFDHFLGLGYAVAMDTLERGLSGGYGENSFSYLDEKGNRISVEQEMSRGLVYVLFYSIYNLGLSLSNRYKEPRFRPFLGVCREVNIYQVLHDFLYYLLDTNIAGPHDDLVIYEWSDNWDIYFNIGKEWWGTFFWTILNKSNKTITIVSASASD